MKLMTMGLLLTTAVFTNAVATQAQNKVVLRPNSINRSAANKEGAQTPAVSHQKGNVNPLATESCTYSFSAGTGPNYMQYCITVNGTFANFQSPAGVEMLDQNGSYEGYGICDNATSTAYYDYNYTDSGNWNSPVTVIHNASEVKIERTTSDGAWTLTQTITKVAGPPAYAKVVMALKNNSGETKYPYIVRFAGFLPDQAASTGYFDENYDGTTNSAWGYNSYTDSETNLSDVYGLMLSNMNTPTPTSTETSWYGFAQDTEVGPNPCDPLGYYDGTITYGQGSGVIEYFPILNKGQTVTITEKYSTF